jgi:acetoin utilization deacetylase AcuC-like enzyme
MPVFYSPRYEVDIGPHVFPTLKYRLVRDRLVSAGIVDAANILEPVTATWDELSLVHTREHLEGLREGTLSSEAIAALELPWSTGMVDGFRVMVGGTIDAACLACGVSRREHVPDAGAGSGPAVVCHLGGGLHHAFPNHGEGFCPFNDVAVAARLLRSRGVERIAIVDLDVHHGNGTAFIFDAEPAVFTFSMHQQHNYPTWKPRGSLDIGLSDGTDDARFLDELQRALPTVMASRPQVIFYLAGADPYRDDQLGGLNLTMEGLRRRDKMVLEAAVTARVPVVVTLAGGYARRVDDTVAIHVGTIEEASRAAARATAR